MNSRWIILDGVRTRPCDMCGIDPDLADVPAVALVRLSLGGRRRSYWLCQTDVGIAFERPFAAPEVRRLAPHLVAS